MKRPVLALLVALAVGVGIVDPYACVQYSSGETLLRDVPRADRARLIERAKRVLARIPAPHGYVLDGASGSSKAEEQAPWNDARAMWASPGAARTDRVYQPRHPDSDQAPPPVEVRVFLNAAVGLPEGLASEGSEPRLLALRDGVAVEVTTVGAEGGRVAVPMTPAEASKAITVVRILVADPATERAFRAAAGGGELLLPTRQPSADPGRIETIVIELYGGKNDVEALARRVPTASIRRLLDRRGR